MQEDQSLDTEWHEFLDRLTQIERVANETADTSLNSFELSSISGALLLMLKHHEGYLQSRSKEGRNDIIRDLCSEVRTRNLRTVHENVVSGKPLKNMDKEVNRLFGIDYAIRRRLERR